MTNPFAAPAEPSGIKYDDHEGRLMIFEVAGIVPEHDTDYGRNTAVECTVHSLTGPTEADVLESVRVYPAVLQSQLKSRIGEKVLGRLGKGVPKNEKHSPPWKLLEATEDDIAKGVAYLDHVKANTVSTPAPVAAAASSTGSNDVPF